MAPPTSVAGAHRRADQRGELVQLGEDVVDPPDPIALPSRDLVDDAVGLETVRVLVHGNVCDGSETCIALEHVDDGRVVFNACSSQAFGVELHNSHRAIVRNNNFEFPSSGGCEIRGGSRS